MPENIIHSVLYFPSDCNRVSVASPRFALLYSCNARTQSYNIIAFCPITTFRQKKQKKCRYPHNIHILIHNIVSLPTTFGTKTHGVLMPCDECNVCEANARTTFGAPWCSHACKCVRCATAQRQTIGQALSCQRRLRSK